MTKKKNVLLPLLVITILLTTNASFSLAQKPFNFPEKIRYKILAQNQAIGNAALFYTKETGVERFKRELSSLRLTLFQESEDNFQYMFESYVFKDDRSLYSASLIKDNKTTSAQLELKQNTKKNYRIYNKKNEWGSTDFQIFNESRTISQLSSILAASEWVAYGKYPGRKKFNYLSTNRAGKGKMAMETELVYVGRDSIPLNGQNIPVTVIALMKSYKRREIHRFKIYNDPQGFCFPVSILFNSTAEYPLHLKAEKLPTFTPPGKKKMWGVVFLDFMDANTQSITNHTKEGKLILPTVMKELKKKLTEMSAHQNRRLVIEQNDDYFLNRNKSVKKILEITFDTSIPRQSKKDKIFKDLAIPPGVDIIITGQCVTNPRNPKIYIRPIIVFRDNWKILTESLMFNKDETICREPYTGNRILCRGAQDYIAYTIKKEFPLRSDEKTSYDSLTIENVYRMIITRGFLCHSVDYGYHAEILEKLNNRENINQLDSVSTAASKSQEGVNYGNHSYTFKTGRDVTKMIASNKKYVIKTLSVNKKNFSDLIVLYWAPLEAKIKTYRGARELIRHLNKISYEGFSDWRLPTIAEVFSISGNYRWGQNFIPFVPPDQTVKVWTSTSIDEREKESFTHCTGDAYLVVNCVHEKGNHRLHFDALCENYIAYILPVRSSGSAIRAFNSTGKKRLFIGNLAFMKSMDRSPMASGELGELISSAVIMGMNTATAANNALMVNEQSRRMFNTDSNANGLTNIFFSPNLTKQERISRIITDMMEPNHMDLMVTGLFIDDGKSESVGIRPLVIYRYDKKLRTKNLQFKRSELVCRDPLSGQETLCEEVAEQIVKAVKELLDQA